MTRRGTLAYYLAAWTCGCFFMTAAIWVKGLPGATAGFYSVRSVFGLLFLSFFGLMVGAIPACLCGFFLRRICNSCGWDSQWQWILAGALLTPCVVGILGSWGRRAAEHSAARPGLLTLLVTGPRTVLEAGPWLAIPAGALTAWVLFSIERAFRGDRAPKVRSAHEDARIVRSE